MAQAITNTVQSTNPLAGLLGLNPKPLASTMSGSTPALITPKAPAPKQEYTPLQFDAKGNIIPNSSKPVTPPISLAGTAFAGANQGGQQQSSSIVQPATAQPFATANVPSSNTTVPITGNTTTPSGAVVNASTGQLVTPAAGTSRGLFPDVLSSLAYSSKTANDALAANAQKIASDAAAKIEDVGRAGARFAAGQKTTGTTPVAEGNAAITAQTTAAEQAAIAAAANQALQGNQQGITAQGQTQSALSSAAGLAQPFPTAYGQTSFNPATGQFDGGGGLPAEVMQQYAQMAVSGQYAAIPSFITSNPVLNAQLNVAAKTLNPNFNPVQAQGASGVLGTIPALQSANTAAEGIKNTITTYLQSNPQLNPSDLAAGNLLNQWIQGKQLTDPKYQTLFNYLNEYTNTLAPILGVGGDPTNLKTQIAQGFVNAAASGQSIAQVLNAMSTLATNKIADLQSGAIGGGTSVPSTSGTGTGNLFDW